MTIESREKRYVYSNFSNKLDEIEKRTARKGRMLDVGCSFGYFLDVARSRGWETYGVEVSKYAADYARQTLGLNVMSRPILETNFSPNYFDVITMWSVIAHFPNPRAVFQYCSDILREDGMLVVSTSNVDSMLAKLRGPRWRIWLPPFHLAYFSPVSLFRLFDMCNLEIVEARAAFPYEKALRNIGMVHLLERLKVSDKLIVYARKGRRRQGDKRNTTTTQSRAGEDNGRV